MVYWNITTEIAFFSSKLAQKNQINRLSIAVIKNSVLFDLYNSNWVKWIYWVPIYPSFSVH